MRLPKIGSYTVNAAATSSLATSVSGASWALAATTFSDNLAHKIIISSNTTTSHAAKTLVLTGTDNNGRPVTETVNLPGANATTTSTKYFKSLAGPLVPSATIGSDTMHIGNAVNAITEDIYPRTQGVTAFNVGMGVVLGGTITVTLQHTYNGVDYFNQTAGGSKSSSFEVQYTFPVSSFRIAITASTAGTVAMDALQVENI